MNVQRMMHAAGMSLLLGCSLHAHAATNVTPAELAMMPGFCDAKIGSQKPEAIKLWNDKLGHDNWIHMHHYCGGLIEMTRYYRGNARERARSLHSALWEFDYVIKYTTPDFYLRPELFYNRGRALVLAGRDGPAISDFKEALTLSPGMPTATYGLADEYKKLGKKDLALAALKDALSLNPDNKGLRRRYQEMGGDLASLPHPAPATPDADTVSATPASTDAAKSDSTKAEPTKSLVPRSPDVIEEKIGNKTDPWCRFCPGPPTPPANPTPSKSTTPENPAPTAMPATKEGM